MRRGLVVLAGLVAFGMLAAPALAETQTHPLEGEFVQTGETGPDLSCPGLRNDTVGSGHEKHVLGDALWNGSACLDFTRLGQIGARGTLTLTSVDTAEELHMTFEGYAPLPGPDGEFSIAGTFAIVGGTGKFAGATGGGTFDDEANIFRDETVIRFKGAIALEEPGT